MILSLLCVSAIRLDSDRSGVAPRVPHLLLLQPEVLHVIYLRALQMVYGTRLEHFYMVRAASSRPLCKLSAIGSPLFLPKSKAYTKLRNLRHDNGLY